MSRTAPLVVLMALACLGIAAGVAPQTSHAEIPLWIVCHHWAESTSLRNTCMYCKLVRTTEAAYAREPLRVCNKGQHTKFYTKQDATKWMRDNCCRRR
jgi:hypothetical protein